MADPDTAIPTMEEHLRSARRVRLDPDRRFSSFRDVQEVMEYIDDCKRKSRRKSKKRRQSSGASLTGCGGRRGETFDPLLFSHAAVWTKCLKLHRAAGELSAFSCKERFQLTEEDCLSFSIAPGKARQLYKRLQAARKDYLEYVQETQQDPLRYYGHEPVSNLPFYEGTEGFEQANALYDENAEVEQQGQPEDEAAMLPPQGLPAVQYIPTLSHAPTSTSTFVPLPPNFQPMLHSLPTHMSTFVPPPSSFQPLFVAPQAAMLPPESGSATDVQASEPAGIQAPAMSASGSADSFHTAPVYDQEDKEDVVSLGSAAEENAVESADASVLATAPVVSPPVQSGSTPKVVTSKVTLQGFDDVDAGFYSDFSSDDSEKEKTKPRKIGKRAQLPSSDFVSAQDIQSLPSAAMLPARKTSIIGWSRGSSSHPSQSSTSAFVSAQNISSSHVGPSRSSPEAAMLPVREDDGDDDIDQNEHQGDRMSRFASMLSRLQQAAGPSRHEAEFRNRVRANLQALIQRHLWGTHVRLTGSTMKGVYTLDSDLDLVIEYRRNPNISIDRQRQDLRSLARFLRDLRSRWITQVVDGAIKATVPVLQLHVARNDHGPDMKVDIVIRNGLEAKQDLSLWEMEQVAIQAAGKEECLFLVVLLKIYLIHLKKNNGQFGGVTGTCALHITLCFLHHIGKSYLAEQRELHGPVVQRACLFVMLLEHYADRYDSNRTMLIMSSHRGEIRNYKHQGLVIVDPRDHSLNLAKGVRVWSEVRQQLGDMRKYIGRFFKEAETTYFSPPPIWTRYLAPPAVEGGEAGKGKGKAAARVWD